MLADQLDYAIGVDPHRDAHALAIVEVRTGLVVFEAGVAADSGGYAQALRLAEQHAPGRRAFAVEGTGSFGAGLSRFLTAKGEQVFEVSRLRRERRSGGKTDALDAVRAARSALAPKRPATPRSAGEREALRALIAAREGAVTARTAALCQLRDLLVTTPEPLRSELRPLTRSRLLARLTAARPDRRQDPELRGTQLALKAWRGASSTSRARNASWAARSNSSPASSPPSCSTSQASARSSPHRSCSPGHTAAELRARPPSRASLAPPRSPPPPARRSATDSTEAATASSTAPSTRSSSPAVARTRRRSTTSTGKPKKERADAKQPAVSSATSPATSTGYSRTRHKQLDKHRSITGSRDISLVRASIVASSAPSASRANGPLARRSVCAAPAPCGERPPPRWRSQARRP